MSIRAGAARFEITPPPGTPLMGYAARSGSSSGIHDPLFARALWLTVQEQFERGILFVSIDLCLLAVSQARELRERIAGRTGLDASRIVVACTHTHSGPETGIAAELRGEDLPGHWASISDGIVEAAAQARACEAPARLAFREVEVWIGRNRAVRDGAMDPTLLSLEVRGADDRVPGRGPGIGPPLIERDEEYVGASCSRHRPRIVEALRPVGCRAWARDSKTRWL